MNNSFYRSTALILFLVFVTNFSFAQSNINLTWDSSVGCVEYDDDVDEFGVLVPIEQISEDVCIKFCENTEVTFSLSDPDGNIDSVIWDQAGGITSSANQNPDFTVLWNNFTNSGNISVQVTLLDGTIIRKAICVEVIAAPIADFTFLSGLNDRCEGDFQTVNNSFDPSGSILISHEWTFTNTNGTLISSSDIEPNVYLGQGTWTIDLTVTNEYNCAQLSDPLVITQNEDCDNCEIELDIEQIELIDEPFIYFEIFGVLVNNSSFDLNVQLSISGGNGFFTPSSIFVPANGSVALNPLRFTPQTPFVGGSTVINMQASHFEGDCFTIATIEFPEVRVENGETEKSSMAISPNPVDQKATITYNLFSTDMENVQLEIYDLNGLKMYDTRLTTASGTKQADVSFLKPTQYIVLIRNNGEILVQSYTT
ncbi:T9SS type A sorting domain-containing protein [Nonlabens sp. Ci31]|uniref:T9SS type A sorting domain-containing protein n=1 Tax=Nonlabens sp. Ci31 TaxID=2608253 RepID=UPI00146403B6|nr:T9SS type A sorting domain-containing protein [Nonlabens sp. Ci31]QJP34132.1 T9SS type A sorting domain-containing protein [Nonlabens sp. Ci31]